MYKKSLLLTLAGMLITLSAHSSSPALTIDVVVGDMITSNEAIVIAPKYDWQYTPKIVQYAPTGTNLPTWWTGTRPEWCYQALTWYTTFEAQGNAATNTRVQFRNLRVYILSNRTRKWSLADIAVAPYNEMWKYPFNYAGDFQTAGTRLEAGGGHSVKPQFPYFHHGYGRPFSLNDPSDVRAVFVAMDFRLVVDNPAKVDDREKARYVVNAGADYYPGKGMSWGLGYAPGVGSGRYLLAKNEWRTATMLVPNKTYGANFDEMRKNPPPLTWP